MKALNLAVILSYWKLLYLFSFRNYGHFKKKCRHKQISFSKSLLLLKGHFQSRFMYQFQCSITHVDGNTAGDGDSDGDSDDPLSFPALALDNIQFTKVKS